MRDPRRVYLLEMWADAVSIDSFIEQIFKMAKRWKVNKIHVEAVGAQKYLIYHMKYYIDKNKKTDPEIANIQVVELKTPNNANAKVERIDSAIPLVERNEVWLPAAGYGVEKFREEAEAWGQKKGLIDLLDVFGYGLQVWKFDLVDLDEIDDFLQRRLNTFRRGMEAVA